MSRSALAAFVVVVVVGVVLVVVRAGGMDRPLLGTVGVDNLGPIARIRPGHTGCQGPVQLEPGTRTLRWVLNTAGPTVGGPPLSLQARAGRRVLARSAVAGGYGGGPYKDLQLASAPTNRLVDLCLVNRGRTPVFVYGAQAVAPTTTNDTSTFSLDGRPIAADAYLQFLGQGGRTFLDRLGAVPRHASAWLPAPLGAWWIALLLVGLPLVGLAGLGAALRSAARHDEQG